MNLGYQYVEEGNTWFLVDHPLKKEKDFLLLKYIMDSTRVEPNYEKFDREVEKLGDRGTSSSAYMSRRKDRVSVSFRALGRN